MAQLTAERTTAYQSRGITNYGTDAVDLNALLGPGAAASHLTTRTTNTSLRINNSVNTVLNTS